MFMITLIITTDSFYFLANILILAAIVTMANLVKEILTKKG